MPTAQNGSCGLLQAESRWNVRARDKNIHTAPFFSNENPNCATVTQVRLRFALKGLGIFWAYWVLTLWSSEREGGFINCHSPDAKRVGSKALEAPVHDAGRIRAPGSN